MVNVPAVSPCRAVSGLTDTLHALPAAGAVPGHAVLLQAQARGRRGQDHAQGVSESESMSCTTASDPGIQTTTSDREQPPPAKLHACPACCLTVAVCRSIALVDLVEGSPRLGENGHDLFVEVHTRWVLAGSWGDCKR